MTSPAETPGDSLYGDDAPVPANRRRVNPGGLMRCCLATLADTDAPSVVGTVLSCAYESDPDNRNMIVNAGGVWVWNRP